MVQMITDFIQQHQSLLIWLTSVSIATFFGTILLIPVLLIRMSADYFVRPQRTPIRLRKHPVARGIFLLIKNILGIVFLIVGIIMLFIPGQGLLTMFIGVSLLNFPGKRKLERRLVFHPKILPVINAIRRKAGRAALVV